MFVVQCAVLQFEDFDFAGFIRGFEFDIVFADGEEEGATFVLSVGQEFFIFRGGEQVLDGWVAEGGEGVADYEGDEAPGKKVGAYEEQAGDEQEQDVQHGAEILVGEVC